MSRSVDLFISSGASLDQLATTIALRAGLAVGAPTTDRGVDLTGDDLAAHLHQHDFVDDGDLVLSGYRYALSLRTTATGHLGTSPETFFLRRVASCLDDHPVLLVLDLQQADRTDRFAPDAGQDRS